MVETCKSMYLSVTLTYSLTVTDVHEVGNVKIVGVIINNLVVKSYVNNWINL